VSDWRALERPPWPLWMLVCVVLDKHRAAGISIEKCAREIRALSGERYARKATLTRVLRHMRSCGYASVELVHNSADHNPTKLHRLTARGLARFLLALDAVVEVYATHLGNN